MLLSVWPQFFKIGQTNEQNPTNSLNVPRSWTSLSQGLWDHRGGQADWVPFRWEHRGSQYARQWRQWHRKQACAASAWPHVGCFNWWSRRDGYRYAITNYPRKTGANEKAASYIMLVILKRFAIWMAFCWDCLPLPYPDQFNAQQAWGIAGVAPHPLLCSHLPPLDWPGWTGSSWLARGPGGSLFSGSVAAQVVLHSLIYSVLVPGGLSPHVSKLLWTIIGPFLKTSWSLLLILIVYLQIVDSIVSFLPTPIRLFLGLGWHPGWDAPSLLWSLIFFLT